MSEISAEAAADEPAATKDVVVDTTDDKTKVATVYSVTNNETKEEHFEATVVDKATGVGVTMTGLKPDEALTGALSELEARLADQVPVVDPITSVAVRGPVETTPAP